MAILFADAVRSYKPIFDLESCLGHHSHMRANRPKNQLRIIGGAWRGRMIAFADLADLRPTPDRVRETLFNWLAPVVRGSRCLDLYAGSGALGLEAASRGAAGVVLVDHAPQVVATLREQVARLQATQVEVVQADVLRWLQGPSRPFDIVFLDPPYRRDLLPGCMRLLETQGWLAPEASIYIEAEKAWRPELPEGWSLYRSKQAGQVGYHLARRIMTAQ
ncbi:MAG: 16S rRNA (guanine(966)-N(2))-methyltransferase RsmD [Thiohalobacterales bacterium]|nr:16S rRNA (guanine(966)-N(2))-methyltransferase RsmD [Thiohalobacterales bacterium]